jgi:two-component sensor histidine kinase
MNATGVSLYRFVIGVIFGLSLLLVAPQLIFSRVLDSIQWISHTHEVRLTIEQVLGSLVTSIAMQRKFLITHDPGILGPYSEAHDDTADRAQRLTALVADNPPQQDRAAHLAELIGRRLDWLDQVIRQAQDGDAPAALLSEHSIDMTRLIAEIRRRAAEMDGEEQSLLSERQHRLDTLRALFFGATVAIGAGVLTLVWVLFAGANRAARSEEKMSLDLKSALGEKIKLLKEINHRVGNSLQLIGTLIDMQAHKRDDPKLAEELAEARARIMAVGLVHKRLHQADAVDDLEFSDYLRNFCEELSSSLELNGRLSCRADAIKLPVETAVAAGLIINELVTNAMKHGYQHRPEGKIVIGLKVFEMAVELRVRDWGVGVPDGFNPEAQTGIGMLIVRTLTRQLQGTLSIIPCQPGTQALVTFPRSTAA